MFFKHTWIINALLKPFGLVLWMGLECDDDEAGEPIYSTLRTSRWRIGKRTF